jgi:hypothetical protein
VIIHFKGNFMRNKQAGNVLFLILMAVALFAALSYAVTQSTRGGGNADKEIQAVDVSILLQQGAAIESGILRTKIMRRVDQVYLNKAALNDAGTVYNPDDTTSNGRIVGLYNSDDGSLSQQIIPSKFHGAVGGFPWTSSFTWILALDVSITVGADDVGTALGDEWLFAGPLSQQICEGINQAVRDDPTISNVTYANATSHHTSFIDAAGVDQVNAGIFGEYTLPYEHGCVYVTGIVNRYFYSYGVIKAN